MFFRWLSLIINIRESHDTYMFMITWPGIWVKVIDLNPLSLFMRMIHDIEVWHHFTLFIYHITFRVLLTKSPHVIDACITKFIALIFGPAVAYMWQDIQHYGLTWYCSKNVFVTIPWWLVKVMTYYLVLSLVIDSINNYLICSSDNILGCTHVYLSNLALK